MNSTIKKSMLKGLGIGIGLMLLSMFNHASAQVIDKGWKQLFNGKDINNFQQVGPGTHYVEDGTIRSHGGMGLLYWKGGKLNNCTIKVVYQMQKSNSNSGVFIRIPL